MTGITTSFADGFYFGTWAFGSAACFLIYEQDHFASIAASSDILGIKSGSAAVILHRVDYSARRVDAADAWNFIQVEPVWRRTNLFQECAGNNQLKFAFDKDGKPMSAETVDSDGEVRRFAPEKEWAPTPEELASFKGDWFSEEAGATLTLTVEADKAFIKQRPATSLPLQPIYKDHFALQGYVVWFTRDKNGKVDGMHVGASRMRDMPFARVK